jgi:hypothetical protein
MMLSSALFTSASEAGTKGAGLISHSKPGVIMTYRYPDAPIPKDWKHNEELSDESKTLWLVPKSWNGKGRPAFLYAVASDLDRLPLSLDEFIKDSLAAVKQRYSDFVATPIEPIRDADNMLWTAFDFAYTHDKTKVLESIAYRDEKAYRFTFVLRTESEADYKKYRPVFMDWIKSYKDVPEASDPKKPANESSQTYRVKVTD